MSSDPVRLAGPARQGCLHQLVREQAERNPNAIAILASGRRPLTYGRLSRQVEDIVGKLNSMGLGRNDRVAMVLPEGPEMAAAFIAIAAGATCAPLNPAYRSNEFDFYLTDLNCKALLVQSGSASPAIAVAQARGIRILELSPVAEAEAGLFTLAGGSPSSPEHHRFAEFDDVALALHTSGTAARPKLVPLTHTNIFASAQNICAAVGLTDGDRCLNVMPLFHIHGLSTLFVSLAAGASVVCTAGFSGPRFFEWLEEFRPTWYTAAPAIHQVILQNAALHPEITARSPLRFIRSASSAMPRQVMADLERVFQAPFIEAYGMTEAAPQIASNRLPPRERKPGSVGEAAGPEVAIMDEAGHLLAPGKTGEVVIRGANVMQAYGSDPALNKMAFTQGWFRTGDQGHLDTDGYLFITGRLKEIINQGGEKISPREVDEVLMNHPAIAQAVTFAVPHPILGESVAAAVVIKPGFQSFRPGSPEAGQGAEDNKREHAKSQTRECLISEIRQFAATRLAHFKVPHQIVIVGEIPKGPTGKLQRIGLAGKLGLGASGAGKSETSVDFTAPRTFVEERLTEILAGVLGLERIGIHDNFFQLGGHSLSATQVMARLQHDFQLDLPMATMFESPTAAALAEFVTQRLAVQGEPLEQQTPRKAATVAGSPAIPRRREAGPCPLSFAQQRLWFLDQIEPGNPAYNMHVAFRLTGAFRVVVLEQSLNEILRRHEALRTTFRGVGGKPLQDVTCLKPLRLPVVDLSVLPVSERQAEALRLADEEAGRPFHLCYGPLFRATLLRLDTKEHVLLLTMHHIVSDGWSVGVLCRELGVLYEAFSAGRASPLPELPIQYADYAIWQREWLQGERLESQIAYWKGQLGDGSLKLDLPTDRPRPVLQTYRGLRHQMVISPWVTEALKALSQQEGATLFMTMLAAFQTLLFRYTGQDDIQVGTPIANRTRVETERLIGFFANTLVLRTDFSGDPLFREVVRRVRATALSAYAHQDLPFEKLVEELQPERDPSLTPFFQVMFAFQNVPMPLLELAPGLTASPLPIDRWVAKFDLTLYLSDTPQGLSTMWQYNSDLFEAATIVRMAGHFRALLEGIVANPERRLSDLPLLSDSERHQLLVAWNQTEAPYVDNRCFHHLFEDQVERAPDNVAVQCGEEGLTYSELNRRANHLARRLQGLGVGPPRTREASGLVGICLTRSAELVVALLGVLKAGGAYLPLDPDYPKERLAFMLEDARVPVLVTEERLRGRLPPHKAMVVCIETDRETTSREGKQNLVSNVTAADLAYVIYTSGSTGEPKGVMISHANLCHYVHAMPETVGITADDRYLHTASFAFSSSVRQFAVPLSRGATVVVATTEQIREPLALFNLIRAERVSIIDIVPSYWRGCNQVLARLDSTSRLALLDNHLRLILSASEPLLSDTPKEWLRHGARARARMINMLGQTETTGIVSTYPIPARDGDAMTVVPIGRPIANTQVYLLSSSLQPVPLGTPGGVYIGGAGVGRGYLNRPELTAEQFVPDPFSKIPGARLYRTGDLARYRPDGNIEFLGRIDHQIKVRGFRVEPREIELVLRQHPGVREGVVVARVEATGGRKLVAYVVANDGWRLSQEQSSSPSPLITHYSSLIPALREFLKRKLPDYMVPSAIVELEALPLTPNGKMDLKALSTHSVHNRPEASRRMLEAAFVAPRASAEEILAAIWGKVLGVDRVGIHDNFFDLGGDSILSLQVINLANEAGLSLRHIHPFQHQTIAELARVAYSGDTPLLSPAAAGDHVEQASREGPVPLADLSSQIERMGRGGDGPSPEASDSGDGPSPPQLIQRRKAQSITARSIANQADPAVRVTVESMRAYGREALQRAGLASEGAEIVVEVQIEASLRGQPTHNVGAIPRYARRIASGLINPQPCLRIERETRISATVDGDNGPGQWIAVVAMKLAIQKARESGVGVVGARRSNHFGAAGHYAWLAAQENLIGLCTTNGGLWLAPTGSLTPMFGNNPVGVGIPALQHHSVVLDISMSATAKGKVGLHLAEGKPLLPGWILDRFGRPSTDPADLAAGLGVPIGGHKGYGLTLVMETLAGVLTGAGFCLDHRREKLRQSAEPPDLGHFFIAINPELFMPIAEFRARVDRMIEQAKAGERAENVEEILIPGEAEMRARVRNLRAGVPLLPATVQGLRKYREEAGLKTELVLLDSSRSA